MKDRNKMPDPTAYTLKEIKKTYKEQTIPYKNYKEKMKKDAERRKDAKKREEEWHKELSEKVKIDKKDKQLPIPQDYTTFDMINKKGIVKKKNGFGSELRIPLSDNDKWLKKIEHYNKNPVEGKAVNPKIDPQPGPAKYSLISHWKGKDLKMKKKNKNTEPEKLPNILGTISKGVSISNYYKKI